MTVKLKEVAGGISIRGSKGCFPAGAKVLIEHGQSISIEQLKVDDTVISFDEQGLAHRAKVTKTHEHQELNEVIELRYWNGSVRCTPNHWVLNQYGAFVEAGTLTIEDALVDQLGHLRPIIEIKKCNPAPVYNLTVEPHHTFICDGIRVHNGGHRQNHPILAEDIIGSKGGGKGGGGSVSVRNPVEHADSLHSISYAVSLDAISNGEVEGPVHPYDPLMDIYLDESPIQNPDGSLNFKDVQVEIRNGTIDQDHIPGIPVSSSVFAVGLEVKTSTPWTRQVTSPDLSAVRVTLRWPALVYQRTSGDKAGDREGTSVKYAIDLAVGSGSFENVLETSVSGKSTRGYERTHRIELPPSSNGWTVRVRRITADSTSAYLQNEMFIQTFAEVIDGKFRHPMTALAGIKIDAQQFQAIPSRAYHWKGRRIRVPANYDPETRAYTGVWDGTFKTAWSDNPAWVFYDILTSNLYGLGDRINPSMIDRYALYQIGAYCDQLVPDGMGGEEPRFTCNAYLQSQADALRIINDLASVFRGAGYWANGQVVGIADMPKDPVYTYANANVINGRFEYIGADLNTRYTVALVSWNDPTDFYRSKVEVVNDREGITRFGVRKTEITAFGCSSRGQAQRVGLYALYTSRMETGGLAFSVGLDGVIPQPGDIIKIADKNRAGLRIGGRLKFATDTALALDQGIDVKPGDTITVNMPDGTSQTRTITTIGGTAWEDAYFWDDSTLWDGEAIQGMFWDMTSLWDHGQPWDGRYANTLIVDPPFDQTPTKDAIWVIESNKLVAQHARVISVTESDGIQFDISAVLHHPGKFDAIDNGARLDPLPVSNIPARAQPAPDNVEINSFTVVHQGTTRTTMEISWDKAEGAAYYDLQWRRDDSEWVQVPRVSSTSIDIPDIFAGSYIARVRAVNALDVPSLWATSDAVNLDGIMDPPPVVTSFTATGEVMAIKLSWLFPQTPSIISSVEIWASQTRDFNNGAYLTTVAFPADSYTLYGLANSTEMWFWARTIDKNGTAGDWTPSENGDGLYGQPSQNAGAILDYLEGEITEGHLAQQLATQISDDHEAVVEASEAIGDLSSSWQVKTEVRDDGRVVQAGVALGASIDPNGQSRSEFLVLADTVAFLAKKEGTLHSPFVFDTQNDTVYLREVFIQDGSIDNAKIKDATIENAKIKNGTIESAKLKDATVGSAKFTDWLESDATKSGVPIIRMNFRTGEVHFPGFSLVSGNTTIDRLTVTNPNIVASGNVNPNATVSNGASFSYRINTGIDVPGGWNNSSSRMFQASATIAGGTSDNGGHSGYSSVELQIGDGLYTSSKNPPSNRIYILFKFASVGNGGGGSRFKITRINWKLVSL